MTEKSINQQIAELLGITNIQPEFIGGIRTNTLIGQTKKGYRYRVPDFEHDLNAVYAVLPENAIVQSFRNGKDFVFQIMLDGGDFCVDGKSKTGYAAAAVDALLLMLTWKAEQEKSV